jgi:hypothetical protein
MLDLAQLHSDWRQRLHAKLDAIIDRRDELEAEAGVTPPSAFVALRLSYAHLSMTAAGPKARTLMREAASLAAEAVGEPLRCAAFQTPANDGPGQRAALRDWLSMLTPILDLPMPTFLGSAPNEYLGEHTVWLGLRALDVGEVWQIFQPGKRGNRPANLYSLSLARLAALQWKRRLLSLGFSEGDANREITAAFGEQWDTIRKWEASCSATLGKVFVADGLNRADHDEKARPRSTGLTAAYDQEPLERLAFAGTQYRQAKRLAAELSPAKQRAARRLEKQPSQISG